MSTQFDDSSAKIRSLEEANAEKDRTIRRLEARIKELENLVGRLVEELEKERRQGKRQAAPFRKDKPKKNRKKPGRKPGRGSFSGRTEPDPTEPPVDVPVKETECSCGGQLIDVPTERVTITELPEAPRPVVTPYLVHVCVCDRCGKPVRGKHPDVADDQLGASAHRFGPRARAAAHVLHYGLGVTVRKVPEVMRVLTGVKITQGTITQDALRQMKGAVGAEYQRLRDKVRESEYVHTDDTGWRIDGKNAHLMAFETTGEDAVTVFQIRDRHRSEEVRELIPADYAGVMTTDRGKSYDAKTLSEVRQNKCVAYPLDLSTARRDISRGNR